MDKNFIPHTQVLPVFVRPEQVRNIGASIRACANFSIRHGIIVRATPFTPEEEKEIRIASAGASEFVQINVVGSIPEAVERCRLVAAIHGKHRSGVEPLTPQEFFEKYFSSPLCHENKAETFSLPPPHPCSVALLFGTESTGLTQADLQYTHCTVTIPTSDNFFSMNLSQAVAVILYEYSRYKNRFDPDKALSSWTDISPTTASNVGARERFLSKLEEHLDPESSPRVSLIQWRELLQRATTSDDDLAMLYNTIKQLTRK